MTPTCPFCTLDPSNVLLRNQYAVVIDDAYPVSPGHKLVIPHRHFESWFDASAEELAACAVLVRRAHHLVESEADVAGVNVGFNDGAAAGQTIPHAHLHIIPRFAGDVLDPTGGVRGVIAGKANYVKSASDEAIGPSDMGLLTRGFRDDALLPHLIDALDQAAEVDIVAAFVMSSGVKLIYEHLEDVVTRGGRVRILTGDYFLITDPSALRRLGDLGERIEVRAFETQGGLSFHPKAYILTSAHGDTTAFVGSSNLSKSALSDGVEWNYRVVPSTDPAGLRDIRSAFDELWNHESTVAVDDVWLEAYTSRREQRQAERDAEDEGVDLGVEPPPEPHEIQRAALEALEQTRAAGNTAGLVVLATGLGKTWLSAFDSKRPQYQRILFVAHREEILKQALKTFRRIRPDASMGLYSGQEKVPEADVLFASIQTLSRSQHLNQFEPRSFDYIVMDEFHHAAARTYRKVIGYFEPKFLLGLTATPERTDGADLLGLCGDNLVYRADLATGIKKEWLSPFDYFGVPDLIDYDNIPWRSTRFDPDKLTEEAATQERAANALEQLEEHGGDKTVTFCVSQIHADFMAEYFRGEGLRAVAVHSGQKSAPRAHSLEQLQAGELDVICAVDMFNEGVDLPDVNTILMLRPTESRILWLQQFGRGLRYRPNKRLAVIDYIGNHKVFLTKAQALLGLGGAEREVAYALDQLEAGEFELPPGCSVTYELEAKEILRSLIPQGNTGDLLENYYNEFLDHHGVRPLASQVVMDGYNPRSTRRAGFGSWFEFVELMGGLTDDESRVLNRWRPFFEGLEKTRMTQSYKMVLLLSMLSAESLPGEIGMSALTDGFQKIARRYTRVRNEISDVLENPNALRRLLIENPVRAWTGSGAMPDRIYFALEGEVFRTDFDVEPEDRAAFSEMVRELCEWRFLEYLERREIEAGPDRFFCRVSHSNGRPILFLPNRDRNPAVPEGWVDIAVRGRRLQASLQKIAINVVTEPGSTENRLPSILRNWFGEDAGAPGTAHRVVFRNRGGIYELEPSDPGSELPDGPDAWGRYKRQEAFDALGIDPQGWEPQMGVVERPDQIVFFVTLDKSAHAEEHQYTDHFISPSEFHWQSQNRTSRTSDRALRYRASRDDDLPVHLFVRRRAKVKSKTQPFIYAGRLLFERWEGDQPVTVWWKMGDPVPEYLREELRVPVGDE